MRHRPLFLFLILLLLMISGCNSISNSLKSEDEQLREALRSYEVTVRWGELVNAYGYLTPELKERTQVPANLENIRITHYDIVSPPRIHENKAEQQVKIRYIKQDRQVVRSLVDYQKWIKLPKQGWRRANPIPFFN